MHSHDPDRLIAARRSLTAGIETAIDGDYVEAVAQRVAELINADDRADVSDRLVDATTLAGELGVERSWVYEHAHELHAVRLGNGPRARLRFNPRAVRATLDCQALGLQQPAASSDRPAGVSRARQTRSKSKAGRVLAVRPRGAS